MKCQLTNLFVNRLGSLKFGLPVLDVGRGRPRVSIVTGIHGDETSGLFVIARLLNQITLTKGRLSFVISVNPLGQAVKQRHNPLDQPDINRSFPGSNEGTSSEQIAARLVDFLKGSDLVIDVHAFTARAPLLGILFGQGRSVAKTQARALLKLFQPDVVWRLDSRRTHERRLSKGLGPHLMELAIPNFAIELQDSDIVSEVMLKQTVAGITRILHHFGMVTEASPPSRKPVRVFDRFIVRSQTTGLFQSSKSPLEPVLRGQLVGTLTLLPSFRGIKVSSPMTGTLLEVARQDIIHPGEKLFSVGKAVGRL